MKPVFAFHVLALLFTLSGCASAAPAGPPLTPPASPGPCRIKTDMELPEVNSIPTNYHSRTRLPDYSHVSDGVTPATMRLQGGKGFVELSSAWQDYVSRINHDNPVVLKYLFHTNSGWQNSDQEGQVEQLAFEDQWVNVLSISRSRAYIQTFFGDQAPPAEIVQNDPRQQLFTVITRDERMIGSPKGDAWIILIARHGEQLWIPTAYLSCPNRAPAPVFFPFGP